MDSILTSVKKMLGIMEEYEHFDADLIMHINSVFAILTQLGVGPSVGFHIRDSNDQWADFMVEDDRLSLVKSYVYLKVRLMFDPPTGSTVMTSINQQIAEYEWRLMVAADPVEDVATT